jgi:subtilisin family serine protease
MPYVRNAGTASALAVLLLLSLTVLLARVDARLNLHATTTMTAAKTIYTDSLEMPTASVEYTGKLMARLKAPLSNAEKSALLIAGATNINERSILYANGRNKGTLMVLEMAQNLVSAESLVTHIVSPTKLDELAPDSIVYGRSSTSLWNLDRIDSRSLDYNQHYAPTRNGAGVNVYVVDTGVDETNPAFAGRVTLAYSAIAGLTPTDCNGHGTHVAGTIGSADYGVAKGVSLFSVRVLDCRGAGSTTTLANGLTWILQNGSPPAVINMSLGYYGSNSVINSLVADLLAAGFVMTAAAGNENVDACPHQPSAIAGVISVASIGNVDVQSSFSNYGQCVDIHAPGESIVSVRNNGSERTLSGTSMSSAHIAGVAALYLQRNPSATPATVATQMMTYATTDLVVNPRGSPNRIVYALVDDWIATAQQTSSPSVTAVPSASATRSASTNASPSHSPVATASRSRSSAGGGGGGGGASSGGNAGNSIGTPSQTSAACELIHLTTTAVFVMAIALMTLSSLLSM